MGSRPRAGIISQPEDALGWDPYIPRPLRQGVRSVLLPLHVPYTLHMLASTACIRSGLRGVLEMEELILLRCPEEVGHVSLFLSSS